MTDWQDSLRVDEYGVEAKVPLSLLHRSSVVRIAFNVDTTTIDEAKSIKGFVNQIIERLPSLEITVKEAVFRHYLFIVEASRYDNQVQLPVVGNADALQPLYQLTEIYLPNEVEEGYFGLGFECEFEIEHGVGMRFRNWQIEEVGDQSEGFSLD